MLVQIAATCLLPPGMVLTAISDIVLGLQLLGLLIASIQNAAASHSRLRSFWSVQALCWLFWFINQGSWIYHEIVLRSPIPDLYIGDVFPFLRAVPILAGFLLRPHLEPSQSSIRFGILDFFHLILWWIFLYVYGVICWQYVSVNLAAYNLNYDRLYFAQELAIVFVLVTLFFQSTGKWRRFYVLFLSAFVFCGLILHTANYALETKTYSSGSWFEAAVSASLAFFMVLTVTGRDLTAVPETSRDSRFADWTAHLAVAAVFSLPLFLIAAVLDRSAPSVILRYRVAVVSITMVAMTALLLLKQHRLRLELRRTNKSLEEAALTDPLTGIRNRRYFQATVGHDVAQSLRAYSARSDTCTRDLVFYLLDMDNFKAVNDVFGHDAGDRVLIEVTRRISSAIRDSDVLLRWGARSFSSSRAPRIAELPPRSPSACFRP
jgi:Diguanylate cyclase, GGDEF domain